MKTLTLTSSTDIIRAAEGANRQLKQIDGEVETPIHAVGHMERNVRSVKRRSKYTQYATLKLRGTKNRKRVPTIEILKVNDTDNEENSQEDFCSCTVNANHRQH